MPLSLSDRPASWCRREILRPWQKPGAPCWRWAPKVEGQWVSLRGNGSKNASTSRRLPVGTNICSRNSCTARGPEISLSYFLQTATDREPAAPNVWAVHAGYIHESLLRCLG